ncbi:MAG TPA: SDR family NAD(P)-dependent oxidoreductase [Bryobacteraceae bacterium]|nr:SDR family NAD(P)-dependent oxidoreductase [Bryobacteraceae bacterium]
MRQRLENKVALITGAAGAIGSEMARLFASEGAAVAVADIQRDGAERVAGEIRAAGGKAIGVAADISSAEQVEAAFRRTGETFGGLDILVNNAIDLPGDTSITKLTEASWDRTIAVCLKGPFLCTRAAIPMMQARGGGSIVTISSVNALAAFGETAYTAAKGGLISMMRLVAADYGHIGVRSNIICPGTIETETSMRYWRSHPAGFARLKEMYPMGRIGQPGEVAHCALFLASEEASFITGAVHVVDGGLMAGRRFEED